MNAKEAVDHLDPQKWAETPPEQRLHLLEAVRKNMKRYANEAALSLLREPPIRGRPWPGGAAVLRAAALCLGAR